MNRMDQVQWGYIEGTSNVFDEYKVRYGKNLSTNQTITIVRTLSLIKGANDKLFLYDEKGRVGNTSAIVKEEWIENFCVGNEQIALVKCFTTKSGSKYYFAPLQML